MKILKDLDAILITNPTNIRYLTGFVGAAPEEREAYCLIAQESIYLFTNALYLEQSKNLKPPILRQRRTSLWLANLKQKSMRIIKISREEPFAKKLKDALAPVIPAYAEIQRKNKLDPRVKPEDDTIVRLSFEENNLTVAEYEKLKKELPGITLVPTRGTIEELRVIKREDEIVKIRAAATITDQCFDFILGKLKESVTESQIAWEIESFIKTHGAGLAFSPIVAFGPNSSQPHYLPKSQPQGQALRLRPPNIILLDFGARVNGYCSDMTRVVFIGKPKAEWVKSYNTVLNAQTAALEYLASRPGLEATGEFADRVARDIVEKAGFPTYPHSLGHGVGLDIHEAPRLRANPSINSGQTIKPGPSETLRAGMVVTVEPGVYVEGQYGIRIEDLILLKSDGIEVLSTSNKNVIVL